MTISLIGTYFAPNRYGLKCRFMGGHTREDEKGELVLVVDEEKKARSVFTAMEVNYVGPGVLKQLRSKTVCSPASCDV